MRNLSTEEKVLGKLQWAIIGIRRGEEWITAIFYTYHIGETDISIGGIGLLINLKHDPDITSFASVFKYVAYVILRLNHKFFQAYASTSTAEEEIDHFYEDMNRALTIPG